MKPTTDDVLKWAREAGLLVPVYRDHIADLQILATLAYAAGAAAMQERCAKVCEEMQDAVDRHKLPNWHQCAEAIRALGDNDE